MLRKIFNIHKGEETRAYLMWAYIFLIISALMIIKPVSHAQFLSQFGAKQLPFVFILVAGFAAVVSILYGKNIHKIDFLILIRRTLYLFLILLVFIWTCLKFRFGENIILYLFFIGVSIFAVIATSQFWILANMVFNPREAKRLFGFIGAGAIAGGILGGYVTKLLIPFIGSENLILIGAFLVLICDPIVRRIWKEHPARRNAAHVAHQSVIFEKTDVPIKMIRSNRHLFYLACIVLLSVAVAKFVDYTFNAMAAEHIHDEEKLAAFLGLWYSNLNVVSLMIQLFVTRQVVGVFGVGTSLIFLPLMIFVGSLTVLIHPGLAAAIFLKVGDGSLKNSVQKSGIELLSLPIPAEIRNPARSYIDIFGDSFATGVSGLLLMILTVFLNVPVRYISLMILIFVGVWLYFVKQVRQEYIHSFRNKIDTETKRQSRKEPDLKNESVIGSMLRILSGKQESRILEVLNMVRDIRNDRLVPSFLKLIHHPSAAIRCEALRNLYFYPADFSDEVESLVSGDHAEVTTEALHYLFHHETGCPEDLLLKYLDHSDEIIRYAALLCATRESRNNAPFKEIFDIHRRIDACLQEQKTIFSDHSDSLKGMCAQIIGIAGIPEIYPFLHIFLRDESQDVVIKALVAAGQTRDRTFLPVLMRKLIEPVFEKTVLEALSFFDTDVIGLFARWMSDAKEELIIRVRIPEIIANMGTQRAADTLVANLENSESAIRQGIIQSLNDMRRYHPDLKFDDKKIIHRILGEAQLYNQTLAALYVQVREQTPADSEDSMADILNSRKRLIHALENKLDDSLKTIFTLLGLKYPPEDIDTVLNGIQSKKPDIRLNALEFLDNLLDGPVKRTVIPIVESSFIENLVERTLDQLGLPTPSEFECFSTLLQGDDSQLKIAALSLIGAMKSDVYIPQLCALLNDKDASIQKKAERTLKRIGVL